ncbi:hypothetical protein NDU88_005479 [Pleurodeles waltl]|uniref:Uncharacterized protein n=1 Tax=Pleurodeles waltl TaxID=8319 RepID=A0AAV7MY09_PLEWA|nr:hypothetical protein NDU88_005479 [Pleurodeles waltl]
MCTTREEDVGKAVEQRPLKKGGREGSTVCPMLVVGDGGWLRRSRWFWQLIKASGFGQAVVRVRIPGGYDREKGVGEATGFRMLGKRKPEDCRTAGTDGWWCWSQGIAGPERWEGLQGLDPSTMVIQDLRPSSCSS